MSDCTEQSVRVRVRAVMCEKKSVKNARVRRKRGDKKGKEANKKSSDKMYKVRDECK